VAGAALTAHRSSGGPRSFRPAEHAGRHAGALFVVVGVLGLLTDFLPGTPDEGHLLPIALDVANIAFGLTAWALPWGRLPHQARLALPLFAFTSIAVNSATDVLPVATIGIWYVLVFVWIGMWNTPRTAVAFGPVALAAYLVPFAFGATTAGSALTAVILVVPVAVLVGASIAHITTAELARRTAEERLATVLDGAPIAMLAFDAEGRVTFNQSSQSLAKTGLALVRPDDTGPGVIGRSVFEILANQPTTLERIKRALAGEEVTAEVQLADQFMDIRYKPFYDGTGVVAGATCVAFEITDRVHAQRERQRLEVQALADSRRQARTDELTELANRRSLCERLDELVAADGNGAGFALLLLDLDRFKEVNDAMGHTVGDRLLHQVGTRLNETITGTELIARLGGDEFALVLAPGSDRAAATTAAQRVIESFGRPFDLSDVSVHANVSGHRHIPGPCQLALGTVALR
jgi:diguanylate cyclase (GGDEF)-like protein